jgi:hypothetical protein
MTALLNFCNSFVTKDVSSYDDRSEECRMALVFIFLVLWRFYDKVILAINETRRGGAKHRRVQFGTTGGCVGNET